MDTPKRLKKWNIASYGLGNLGWNFVNFISNYGLLFMTDYMGMSAGIVAMLIAVSKILDGITDVLAGTIIDRTESKMGKARVWILRMTPAMAVTMILFFFNPTGAADGIKYAYFFIFYTLFNDVFYTMYLVSNSTIQLYMTDNSQERVYLSIMNMMGNVVSSVLVSSTYLLIIGAFGNGVYGWRMVAIIYAVIFAFLQIFYITGTKEMPHKEQQASDFNVWQDLARNIKYLLKNRFFILQFFCMFLYTACTVCLGTVIPYYCMRVLGDMDNSKGTQTWLVLAGMGIIFGLFLSPMLMRKLGMYKTNLVSRIAAILVYFGVIAGVYTGNYIVTLVFELLFYAFQGPYTGTITALTGKICEYTKLKDGVDVEATVSSCNSMGTKIGNALGVAVVGWLLSAIHYDGTLAVQPQSAINMITFIFAWIPLIVQTVITVLLGFMDVEKAIGEIEGQQ